jgi:transcriptional regulator with XRE-family HTH domain
MDSTDNETKNPILEAIGQRLAFCRNHRGESMEQVGALFDNKSADSRRKRVWAWEQGNVNIKALELVRLAEHFKVSVGWLITGKHEWPFSRELLGRVSRLSPEHQNALGQQLVGAVSAFESLSPPSLDARGIADLDIDGKRHAA